MHFSFIAREIGENNGLYEDENGKSGAHGPVRPTRTILGMFAFFNIQDWPVSLNSVIWLLTLVYERPISIGIFIFFKRRIFIRNESVL